MSDWLLFTYKVPSTPSARRVYVWRKLKGLGALLVHDAVWVLPDRPQTREKLQWLAAEVKDMPDGEAELWEAQQIFTGAGDDLVRQFSVPVDASYQEISAALDHEDADLAELARRYRQTAQIDFFQSELGGQVRDRLAKRCGGEGT